MAESYSMIIILFSVFKRVCDRPKETTFVQDSAPLYVFSLSMKTQIWEKK